MCQMNCNGRVCRTLLWGMEERDRKTIRAHKKGDHVDPKADERAGWREGQGGGKGDGGLTVPQQTLISWALGGTAGVACRTRVA